MAKSYERIPLSEKYNVCGGTLYIMDLFGMAGYFRPRKFDDALWKKILYGTWTMTFISSNLLAMLFFGSAAVFMYWPDITKVSGATYILAANLAHFIKLVTLQTKRKLFISLVDFFMDASKERVQDGQDVDVLIAYEKTTYRNLITIQVGVSAAVFGLMGVGHIMYPSGLPLVAWYPFEINGSPLYEFIYLHQMTSILIAAILNVTMDMFTNSLVIQLCCHFELLKRDIQRIHQIEPKRDQEIAHRLRCIIDRHCILKERCSQLGEAYGASILAQILCSSYLICIGFYHLYRASTNLVTLVSILSTLTGGFLQIYFYCYHGNELIIKTQSMCRELAELPWFLFSEQNKKTLLLMIWMSQKPVILRAGGLVNISLGALMAIIKMSYSFFSVIANVDAKRN